MDHINAQVAQLFLRDALPPDERARITAHLGECAACAAVVEQEQRLSALLRFDEHAVTAEGALERTLDRVDTMLPAGGAWRLRPRHAAIVLLALGAAGLLLLLRSGVGPDRALNASAAALGITPELQQRVLAHLDELTILQQQPWMIDDYDTITTLSQLVTSEAVTP